MSEILISLLLLLLLFFAFYFGPSQGKIGKDSPFTWSVAVGFIVYAFLLSALPLLKQFVLAAFLDSAHKLISDYLLPALAVCSLFSYLLRRGIAAVKKEGFVTDLETLFSNSKET
ncbi:MAG: hypothetical protein IPK73_21005 [Candidatus Obscuribacter sp.]|nr:hypothetical protein [Candidatus Obscuribacter sp.]MBK9276597.1 hypothetical protein [Candidatus Obscuribacter sp.]MBL8082228.1 hypothetical protein [Candidatus Obscuribacter sp.]